MKANVDTSIKSIYYEQNVETEEKAAPPKRGQHPHPKEEKGKSTRKEEREREGKQH